MLEGKNIYITRNIPKFKKYIRYKNNDKSIQKKLA
jgi:hypothetical protein